MAKGRSGLGVLDRLDGPQEQQFLMRSVEGGFELDGPGATVSLADDDKFNDRLLAAIGDAMETTKQKPKQ